MKKINQPIFWILSFTWGILMTLIGLIVAVVLCSIGCKPRRNQYGLHFMCGHHWGGLSLGCVNITDHTPSQHTLNHEFGHSIQNCMYGPLMVFITLASVTRYHYRNWIKKHKPQTSLPPYDSIWFEGEASELGEYYKQRNQ